VSWCRRNGPRASSGGAAAVTDRGGGGTYAPPEADRVNCVHGEEEGAWR